MIEVATGWTLDVERGPDWLFVKLDCEPKAACEVPQLAERIWSLFQQHFAHRLVLECERIELLHSALLAQFIALHRRIISHGGLMRLCGLSAANREVLERSHLDRYLPSYADRTEAVMASRPLQPR